jgi:hypothetical protein
MNVTTSQRVRRRFAACCAKKLTGSESDIGSSDQLSAISG